MARVLCVVLLLCWLSPVQGEVNHTSVLIDLYDSLNGPKWPDYCQWDFSEEDYCKWHPTRVICDSTQPGEIREITLVTCDPDGTVPSSFQQLTNLQVLRLNSKYLSAEDGPVLNPNVKIDFSQLRNFSGSQLRILSLERTDVGRGIPEFFQDLSNLDTLVMMRMDLTGPDVLTKFTHMTRLQNLHFFENSISGTIPTEFGRLTRLEQMTAHTNNIQGTIPSQLSKLTLLQAFDFGDNNLSGTLPTMMGRMQGLAEIKLYNNPHLEGTIPTQFGQLSDLVLISMANCSLEGSVPTTLKNLSSLNTLDLAHNKLTSLPLTEWSVLFPDPPLWTVPAPDKCENTTINLMNYRPNHLDNLYAYQVPSPCLQQLLRLDLSHNRINMTLDQAIAAVSGLAGLSNYDLSNNLLHGQDQLRLFTDSNNIKIQGSPSLNPSDSDNPCDLQRVSFSKANTRRMMQNVVSFNIANNPHVVTAELSNAINFEQMGLRDLNISGNLGMSGILWASMNTLDSFDATNTGFHTTPSNLAVDFQKTLSVNKAHSCFGFSWEDNTASTVMVDSAIVGYTNCICAPGYQSNGSSCELCSAGHVTPEDGCGSSNCTCSPCAPGSFAVFEGLQDQIVCKDCGSNQFQSESGQTRCGTCNLGSSPNENKTRCLADPGYWAWPANDPALPQNDSFFKCYGDTCLGNSDGDQECVDGHDSTLCLSCAPSHAKVEFSNPFSACVECLEGETARSVFMLVVFVVFVGVIVSFAIRAQNRSFLVGVESEGTYSAQANGLFKVLLAHLQVISSVALLEIPWAPAASWFFSFSDSLGLGGLSFACIAQSAGGLGYTSKAIFALVAPVCGLGLAAVGISVWELYRSSQCRNKKTDQRVIVAGLAISISMHYFCTRAALELLTCLSADAAGEPFPDTVFLRLDPEYTCRSTTEDAMKQMGLAVPLLLIYGMGIPVVAYVCIRHDVSHLTKNGRYSYLYADYKDSVPYWDLAVLVRKSATLATTLLFDLKFEELEITVAVVVLFLAMIAQVVFKPFREHYINVLDIIGLAVAILTILSGVYIRSVRSSTIGATIFVVVVNCAFVVGAILVWLIKSRKARAKQQVKEVKDMPAEKQHQVEAEEQSETQHQVVLS